MVDALTRYYDSITNFAPKIPSIVVSLLIGFLIIKLLSTLFYRVLKVVKVNQSSRDLMLSIASVLMWILLLAEIAGEIGLSRLALTISGSIIALGFAVANGASALTADIIAGLFMSRDKDFDCGFRIKVGDVEGVVDRVDIRKVRIKGDDGKMFVLPSSKVDSTGWVVLERK